jgi:Fumarylacetoacetase N-terminal domain 2
MKLASLKSGRDGQLVVVSNDLAWYADAAHITPTLQAALDNWDEIAPRLEALATDLEPQHHCRAPINGSMGRLMSTMSNLCGRRGARRCPKVFGMIL